MDSKVTWRVEVLSAVDSKSKSMNVNAQITKVTWRIENFSIINEAKIYSENFTVDGIKWRIRILHIPPSGNCMFIYLEVADSANLCSGWSSYAQFGAALIDQIDRKSSSTTVSAKAYRFDAKNPFISPPSTLFSKFDDPKRGYLIKDACLVEFYVSTDRTEGLISRNLMLQTNSDEDMNTFFTKLEAALLTSSIVCSQEEAKEALSKVDEALNMTPINFYNSGKFLELKHAFIILPRFSGSSIPIEIQQKNELLLMEERLKELADRAVKAAQDKHHLAENQSMRLTITRCLDCNLLRYKEVDSEVQQVEQKLAALLGEREKIFKSSQKIKMELEALGNDWPGYEAKVKVAEEEERRIEAEWARMKDFISSIKEKI